MLRDHMLNSPEGENGSGSYELKSEYSPVVADDSQPHEYPDLIQIRTEDLLSMCGEASQSLSNLIEQQDAVDEALLRGIQQSLPDLEEHDKAGLNFELNLQPQQKGKVNWFYSKEYNKVYIKLNEIFNVEAIYYPRSPSEKLYLRSMMVFTTEVSEPVVRCENHSSKDFALVKNIKHSVLRCENPNAIYEGTLEGKNVGDRLSVRIPFGCVQSNEDNLVKQTVALKFVCQNSCVGRRETSIIFYLENANGDVLSKRVVSVKICSCPKRDMRKDEASEFTRKRARQDMECPVGKKILRLESNIKKEVEQQDTEDGDDSFPGTAQANDIVITPTGVRMVLDLPDLEVAQHVLQCAYNMLSSQILDDPGNPAINSKRSSLKKTCAKLKRLRELPK